MKTSKSLLLRGLEEAGEILDGVVFLDTVADQCPGDAFLTQDIVLRVDDDERGIVGTDVHGTEPLFLVAP